MAEEKKDKKEKEPEKTESPKKKLREAFLANLNKPA